MCTIWSCFSEWTWVKQAWTPNNDDITRLACIWLLRRLALSSKSDEDKMCMACSASGSGCCHPDKLLNWCTLKALSYFKYSLLALRAVSRTTGDPWRGNEGGCFELLHPAGKKEWLKDHHLQSKGSSNTTQKAAHKICFPVTLRGTRVTLELQDGHCCCNRFKNKHEKHLPLPFSFTLSTSFHLAITGFACQPLEDIWAKASGFMESSTGICIALLHSPLGQLSKLLWCGLSPIPFA